jgi:hypothetical protein
MSRLVRRGGVLRTEQQLFTSQHALRDLGGGGRQAQASRGYIATHEVDVIDTPHWNTADGTSLWPVDERRPLGLWGVEVFDFPRKLIDVPLRCVAAVRGAMTSRGIKPADTRSAGLQHRHA